MARAPIFAAFLLALASAAGASAQTLEVIPDHVLVDETAAIRASGLQPGEHVSIQATLTDGAGAPWKSEAEFVADPQGMVDTSKQAPVGGSYDGISAMGLVLFMKAAQREVAAYTDPPNLGSQIIQFQLVRNGQPAARAQLEQRRLADGVRQFPIILPIEGTLFVPSGSGPFPGVLVVSGSECGVPAAKAAWLASHGYAALALAYCGYDNLPKALAAIPLEYFGAALDWMRHRLEIESDQIGVLGVGRGGELALQLGAMYPHVKAVVAYAPANVLYPSYNTEPPYAWTWKAQPLPYISQIMWRNALQDPTRRTEAQIPVERTQGPILLISGGDDKTWTSTMMADAIVARLKQFHFAFRVETLNYDHAGHYVGRPEYVPGWVGQYYEPTMGASANHGGSPAGDAQSTVDSIPKVLAFLSQSLRPPPATPAKQ
jgi:dienelactone hydrolase